MIRPKQTRHSIRTLILAAPPVSGRTGGSPMTDDPSGREGVVHSPRRHAGGFVPCDDLAVLTRTRRPAVDAASVALVTLVVFAWAVFSTRLGRADLSAPIVFVSAGLLLSEGLHAIDPDPSHETVKVLAEVTLVWVLFADQSRAGVREIRA